MRNVMLIFSSYKISTIVGGLSKYAKYTYMSFVRVLLIQLQYTTTNQHNYSTTSTAHGYMCT